MVGIKFALAVSIQHPNIGHIIKTIGIKVRVQLINYYVNPSIFEEIDWITFLFVMYLDAKFNHANGIRAGIPAFKNKAINMIRLKYENYTYRLNLKDVILLFIVFWRIVPSSSLNPSLSPTHIL